MPGTNNAPCSPRAASSVGAPTHRVRACLRPQGVSIAEPDGSSLAPQRMPGRKRHCHRRRCRRCTGSF
eukprot:5771709-Alexandrium_andersonii.AAC.1